MHRLELDSMWEYCPQSWKNFTDHIEKVEGIPDGRGCGDYIDKYLLPYNGTYAYIGSGEPGYVEFASTEDATAFTVRFG
jgi:hypothetical protein